MTKNALAIYERNLGWANNPKIPKWVDPQNVGLDQFFTRPAIAEECYKSLCQWMKQDDAVLSDYKFIEPSAGTGSFFDILPLERRIGLDIVQFRPEYRKVDFLSWHPPANGQMFAVIGNPPFGYRAWLALAFMNHAARFAKYVGMILPMSFQSDGKGSPKHRINGLKLVHMEHLPQNSFVDVNGKPAKVNALWQIWRRGVNNIEVAPTCGQWIDLFTVDNRKERLCGQERMNDADYFLQRTFYNEVPTLVRRFDEVKYVCGYGIVTKKDKRKVVSLLRKADWKQYSNLAAHNCRHISMYHIRKVLTDVGLIDD